VVADVIDGPPVPLEERQPGLPPDLCAIVARAMARDRAARYRDAGELAEELRRFQTGQLVAAHHYRPRELVARWVQKNRAAVLVAVVAFLALTATGGVAVRRVVRERDAAQAARADAEAQRAAADGARLQAEAARDAAEDLVAFMTSTLRDRLAPVGRLDVLAGLGDAVLAYYDKLGVTEGSSDPRALQRRASALSILANVAFDAGRLDEAQAAWRRGLAMREELVAREGRAEQRAELVETLSYLGQVELARGEVQAASEAYQSCLRRVEELAPGDARDRWSVACRMGLGDVALELGRADEALARYTEALTDTRKHLPGAADAFWRRRLAMLLDRLGNAQRARGDLAAALAAFQELLDVTRALAEESPDDTGRLEDLAAAWSKLGEVRADLGDAAGALAAYREDLAISRRLVAHDGDNAEWRHGLTVSLLNVADALVDERPGEAEPLYQECLEVVGGLRARDARRATFRAQEAECRRGLGHVALARGQASAALPHLRTALALTQELVAAEPESFRYQGALVLRWLDLGEAHAAAGKGKDARASYREGLAVAEALLARDPKNPEFVMLRDHMRDKAR
jgi:tetratricopeptide (TPR) repeat protein